MKAGSPSRPPGAINRIVQHGTQSRSSREWALAAAAIQSGKLGKLLVSRALCYKPRGSIGVKPTTAPPRNSRLTSGSAPPPSSRITPNLVHYNWHWFWDFGNGDIGNQGVHQMDIARWLIPAAELERPHRQCDLPQDRHEPGGPVRLSRSGPDP